MDVEQEIIPVCVVAHAPGDDASIDFPCRLGYRFNVCTYL